MKNIIAFLFLFSSLFASSQTQYIGAPNTTVVARGNMKVDSILYLPKREKTPTDTGALRYQISDSSLYVWTGSAWRKAKNDGTVTSVSAGTGMSFTTITSTGSVSADTNVLATKSYKQKGDDSLGAIIATKGTGTVTSVASGYGINGGTITTTGTLTADTLNLATRLRLQKVGDSLGVLISEAGGGTVTGVSAGIGMSFTTITSSGAVNADTAILSTKAWRQKGIDSVSQNLGLYLPLVGGTLTGGLTGTTAAFNSSGSGNTFSVTHSSGSGIGVNIEKGGNGEGLYVNKTSGTGNAATIIGTLNATTLVKSGGTSSQYLMADGSTSTLTNPVTGTGTTNYVPKWSGTNTQTISQIFDNGTNVGIGNTSPSYKLDISGTLRNTTGAAFATSSGNVLVGTTTDGGLYKLDVQGALRNTTGANFATSSGNVVVGGTGTGGAKFDVVGSGRFSTNLNVGTGATSSALTIDGLSTSGQGASITFRAASSDIAYIGRSSYVTSSAINTNGLSFGTLSSSINFLTVAGGVFVERFRIDSATGNVGVSTASPTEKLHVTGRIRATTIDSTATGMNMLYADANGVIKKAAVPSGGSGTVTSVATGFGLSGGTITTTGTLIVDSAAVATRARVQKGIDSVASLTSAKVGGTGISGYFPKWTGTSSQDTSQLFQLGQNIGIGTASPAYRIHLPDAGNVTGQAMIAGTVLGSDGNGQTIRPSGSVAMALFGQNDIGYLYGAAVSSTGRWGINTRSLNDATFNVDGSVKIVTIDSTATAMNMLYQDANGVIKKAAGLSMADDVMTASGSWVATKDAGSGVTINNVAYTTNGTTKMVTVDGNFYIPEASWTDNTWVTISTIPAGFRPSKTINWNSDFIVTGAEYERADNTDFTGAQGIQGQMRIRDDGTVQINATMDVPTIAAGGSDYIIVQFTQSYIIK